MARESKYIKKITNRDVSLLKNLARVGLTDRLQANTFHKINNERLSKLENSNYIKRENFCVNGRNNEIIQLSDKGKVFCRNNLEITHFARANTSHLTHDLKLSMAYNSLPKETQETWEHEDEILRDIYANSNSNVKLDTCIDARVTMSNGEKIAIEVIGHSYSEKDIAMKENIAISNAGCCSIEFIK